VNLRTRWVQVFDHRAEGQLLYAKERFLAKDHPESAEMMTRTRTTGHTGIFKHALRELGIIDESGSGPNKAALMASLDKHGLDENLNPRARNETMQSSFRAQDNSDSLRPTTK